MSDAHPSIAPLTLQDLQSGVVGQTGTVWTIAPDGAFAVARHVATKTAEPHRRGQLSADQRGEWRELLARLDPGGLPAEIGAPRVNGRQILLTYGDTACTLNLPAGGGSSTDPNAARVLELADAMRRMTGN